ncbi:uncharacterized protein MYU51_018477 [Penicillium brevicompactum]
MDKNRIQLSRVSKTTPNLAASQPPKLKDSCDKCSSSKVRCTKEKPHCLRCEKLGYDCFYSPARRVGRPYRSKELPLEKKDGGSNRPSTKQRMTQFIDESVGLYSRSKLIAGVDANLSSAASNPTPRESLGPSELENCTRQVQPHIEKRNDTHQVCMTVALDLLADLEASAEQMRQPSLVNPALARTTPQTMTAALRRLSNILICPCSGRAEVGMLVSAICMSITDMHAIKASDFQGDLPSAAALGQTTHWDSPGVEFYNLTGHGSAEQALRELSEATQLIIQFTERYNHGCGLSNERGIEDDPELLAGCLPPLASFLQQKLDVLNCGATRYAEC